MEFLILFGVIITLRILSAFSSHSNKKRVRPYYHGLKPK